MKSTTPEMKDSRVPDVSPNREASSRMDEQRGDRRTHRGKCSVLALPSGQLTLRERESAFENACRKLARTLDLEEHGVDDQSGCDGTSEMASRAV
jgi:hypothetical protein